MSAPALSEASALRVELTVMLMSGLLNGSLATQQPLSQTQQAARLPEAQRVADRYRNECFAIAGSLMSHDAASYPDDQSPTRVRSATMLFSAAVTGLVSSGTSPADALSQVNRTRDRLLLTANRVLVQQRDYDRSMGETASDPSESPHRRLAVGAWRQSRPLELESQPSPVEETPVRRPGMR